MALYLTEDDVAQVLTMADTLDAVEASLREQGLGVASNLSRSRMRAPRSLPAALGTVPQARSFLNLMGAALPAEGIMGYKAYVVTPSGVRFQIFLYSLETGTMLAVVEANRIGQFRIGAASGIATKYLARPDAATVGVYGTGFQARGQVLAVCSVRPIRRVVAYGRNPERLALFCSEMQEGTGVEVVPAESMETVARVRTSLLPSRLRGTRCCREPGWSRASISTPPGSNSVLRREIDEEVVRRSSRIFIDSLDQGKQECGDLVYPVERGIVTWAQVRELSELVAGRVPGRETPDEITLFESHGLATWDLAVSWKVYQRAQERGLGQQLPF